MPAAFYLCVTVFLGLCLGSFATALSWRLPRGISVSFERSKCPKCGRILGVADLVPVFSWLLMRGRCRSCRAPIGWRYPLIELATLALCIAFYERFGFSPSTVLLFCLAPVVIAAADIDFSHMIIPDGLNLAVLLLGMAVLAANSFSASDPPEFILAHGETALGGMALYGIGSLVLRQGGMALLKREPLGWGDVKFFAASGFWMGTNPEVLAHFLILSGTAGVVIALLWRKFHKEAAFPFGPALLLAFIIMLIAEPPAFIFQ
ncbi:MAG: prepilin peptidase [Alphaproteobacteria bacterium]|nr:MAG: prepilin peptidase [Alphaproteobacteria bacterium]